MAAELTRMVGADVFERLLAYLRQRDRLRAQRVALPHPAVRYAKTNGANGVHPEDARSEDAVLMPE